MLQYPQGFYQLKPTLFSVASSSLSWWHRICRVATFTFPPSFQQPWADVYYWGQFGR